MGRLFVASQSKPGKYLCDLLAYGGKGQCSCPNWCFTIGPHRERGEEPPKALCKHLYAAKLYFADMVIQRMLAQSRDVPPDSAINDVAYQP